MTKRKTFREEVAEEMIRHLEAGTAPWQKPWQPGASYTPPFNPTTGKNYHGINTILMDMSGRNDPRWMTFKQAKDLGGQVRKGEKATPIEYWKFHETSVVRDADGNPKTDKDGNTVTATAELDRPKVFYASVFNAEQIKGLEPYKAPPLQFDPIDKAEETLSMSRVTIRHDQNDRAYYSHMKDSIHMPSKAAFPEAYGYYATALHELGHATGHKSRMNRPSGPFGSEAYAKEELKAEMASYMACRELGLGHQPERHAAYVESWIKAIKEDRNTLFQAARDADRIATWILEPEKRQQLEQAMQEKTTDQRQDQKTTHEMNSPEDRTWLNVPFAEKDEAKALGARWDKREKSWYMEGEASGALLKWKSQLPPAPVKDPVQGFAEALRDRGLVLEGDPIMDGKWQRVCLEEDRKGKKSASYVGHLDGLPNGLIKNFKTGELDKWVHDGQPLPKKETEADRDLLGDKVRTKEQTLVEAREEAAKKASYIWRKAETWATKDNSDYLKKKDVKGYGIKVDQEGKLLIPLRDEEGKIHSLQIISDDGKKFIKNGRKAGTMHLIDPNKEIATAPQVFIAEGYATAATIYEATGKPVVTAYDAGNLKLVAEALHAKYPKAELIIAADNDHKLKINVGQTKGADAAQAVGGRMITPLLTDAEKEQGLTDWNDLQASRGLQQVTKQVRESLRQPKQAKDKEMAMA